MRRWRSSQRDSRGSHDKGEKGDREGREGQETAPRGRVDGQGDPTTRQRSTVAVSLSEEKAKPTPDAGSTVTMAALDRELEGLTLHTHAPVRIRTRKGSSKHQTRLTSDQLSSTGSLVWLFRRKTRSCSCLGFFARGLEDSHMSLVGGTKRSFEVIQVIGTKKTLLVSLQWNSRRYAHTPFSYDCMPRVS